ncbi:MAG: winged helix-turn-helix transcriptional regulator [Bacillota bacterium]|nr:winged helix-turn-helix transcriptional regulator [Bacillota bacterium]
MPAIGSATLPWRDEEAPFDAPAPSGGSPAGALEAALRTCGLVCDRYMEATRLVERRWTLPILAALLAGPRRFSQIAEEVPGLSDRLLSLRLRDLARRGLVVREVEATTVPVRIRYRLSEKGYDLWRTVVDLHRWADRWL